MKLHILKGISITLLIALIATQSHAQATKAGTDIMAKMLQYQAMGLQVVVVKKGEISYTHAFGLKDAESNTQLTDKDIFRIASISKSFSATSIMQLAEAKKLSLKDDFSKLVGFKIRNPKFPETVITLKMVMSHTASINDSQGYFSLDAINPDKNPDFAKCYNNYEPGTGYQYCNLDFNMVGTVIEKISGERFDQYVKHHILDPLGLYGGYCVDSLDKSRFATLYEYDAKAKKLNPSPAAYNPRSDEIAKYQIGYSTPIFSPTGGMKISATDLAKYMTMHMNKGNYHGVKIISKKSAKEMQTVVAEKDNYGLAIMTKPDLIPGYIMKGHTGSAYGLYSAMFFQPDEKFGFVVITNGCNVGEYDGVNPFLKDVMNILYDNFIK
ncbi:beta-lactamase family protein [Mucilaginibacter mali]|uniref:Beta-lactamase family protein n=2 Tax=Mucilaginibacter mali TaxID=2740462 RepID=A0A7D4TSV8_9SPHI|nr:beta-lactamase family protein [Mucilaginibacter mali]